MIKRTLGALTIAAAFFVSCGSGDKYADSTYFIDGTLVQPEIGVRSVKVLTVDKLQFKDSNNNGKLDTYEDWRLSPAKRAEDLVKYLDQKRQLGLLSEYAWISVTDDSGQLTEADKKNLQESYSRFGLIRWPGVEVSPVGIARKTNALQELAESEEFGIPVLITSDPVFSAISSQDSTTLMHQNTSHQILDWTTVMGFGAINDENFIYDMGLKQAASMRAMGVRWMLGPQLDLASEPMWARVYDTFGSDSERVTKLSTAYILGLQGGRPGMNPFSGIALTVKHFPGGGANENGMDSHTRFGQANIFPGNNLEEHVNIFKDVLAATNPLSIMPNYSLFEGVSWNGTPIEEVNSHYSTTFMQDILRKEIGWDGMVTSDWSAVKLNTDATTAGQAWGTESWSNGDRIARYVQNGGHQIGQGSSATSIWENALLAGSISDAEIAHNAYKTLEMLFATGSFENPYVDAEKATEIVTSFTEDARNAMMRAFTLLKNDQSVLPLNTTSVDQDGDGQIEVYWDGLDDNALSSYVTRVKGIVPVADIKSADYAIIRVAARHGIYNGLDGGVPLSWADPVLVYDQTTDYPSSTVSTSSSRGGTAADNNKAALSVAEYLNKVSAAKKANPKLKIILVVSMIRPFIISDYLADIDVLAADFGITDDALLDMLFQRRHGYRDYSLQPTGTLPMEIPSSQKAVYDSMEDVPDDSENPTFKVGFGITKY